MSKISTKGKSTAVWVLMGLLMLGLGGFGIENFAGGSSDIGKAGEVSISDDDYARALRLEMQRFAQQTGRGMTVAEAQGVGLPQNVLGRLFLDAALEDQTRKLGISVGDERVARQILEYPAFQGLTGQFDTATYNSILRNEGLTPARFEQELRVDEARRILQRAVVSGVSGSETLSSHAVAWLLETRDIRWLELTAEDLAAPVAPPDEDTIEAWHRANADRFTSPERRGLTYVWLTPDHIEEEVQIDEQALRDLYQERIDEFQKPERRLVERLNFHSEDAAEEARQRIERGEIGFEGLAAERGLSLSDIDLGEATRESLGDAGEAVFAMEQPGVVGPLPTSLGPALFSMNAILEPQDVSFEEARGELRGEAALDRARRQIDDLSGELDDLIAGGASLEELADETPMRLGRIEWVAGETPEQGSIAGYPAFRAAAARIAQGDFPEVAELDDGGLFLLRLDEVTPPELIPLDQVRDEVVADWIASETHRQLLAMADEYKVNAVARSIAGMEGTAEGAADESGAPQVRGGSSQVARPNPAPVPGAANGRPATDRGPDGSGEMPVPDWQQVTALPRDGHIEGGADELVNGAFLLSEPGETEVVDARTRVFLVTLDQINAVDPDSDQARQVQEIISRRLGEGLQQDIFEYYARAIQAAAGMTVNQSAVDAVNSRM